MKEEQKISSTGFEKLTDEAKDEDKYDTEAEEELDRLEQGLEREKATQVRWKKEHRRVTEECEK